MAKGGWICCMSFFFSYITTTVSYLFRVRIVSSKLTYIIFQLFLKKVLWDLFQWSFSLSDDVQSHCKSLFFFHKINFWFCYLNMKAQHFFFLHFLAYVITDKREREKGIICYYYWFFRFFVSFMFSFNMIFQEISYFVSLVSLLSLFMYSTWSFCFVIEMPSSCLDL